MILTMSSDDKGPPIDQDGDGVGGRGGRGGKGGGAGVKRSARGARREAQAWYMSLHWTCSCQPCCALPFYRSQRNSEIYDLENTSIFTGNKNNFCFCLDVRKGCLVLSYIELAVKLVFLSMFMMGALGFGWLAFSPEAGGRYSFTAASLGGRSFGHEALLLAAFAVITAMFVSSQVVLILTLHKLKCTCVESMGGRIKCSLGLSTMWTAFVAIAYLAQDSDADLSLPVSAVLVLYAVVVLSDFWLLYRLYCILLYSKANYDSYVPPYDPPSPEFKLTKA